MWMVAVALGAGAALGAPADAMAQQVYEIAELSEKPRIASPMAAQRAIQSAYPGGGVEGKVLLQFVVTESGKVDASSVEVQSADHSSLADAAKQAIRRIEFVPGQVNGAAVATRVVFPISFVSG